MSKEFAKTTFVKIDVDEFPELAGENGIRSVPTFIFFKGNSKVSEVRYLTFKLLALIEIYYSLDCLGMTLKYRIMMMYLLTTTLVIPTLTPDPFQCNYYVYSVCLRQFAGASEDSLRSNLENLN